MFRGLGDSITRGFNATVQGAREAGQKVGEVTAQGVDVIGAEAKKAGRTIGEASASVGDSIGAFSNSLTDLNEYLDWSAEMLESSINGIIMLVFLTQYIVHIHSHTPLKFRFQYNIKIELSHKKQEPLGLM